MRNASDFTRPKLVLPTERDLQRQDMQRAHPDLHHRWLNKFFEAADRSDLDTVMECLSSGIPINSYDMMGRTIFHIAASNGSARLLSFALKWPDKDINTQTFDFRHTPLHAAVINERDEAVGMLLRAKASVDIPNGNGSTAMHMAVLSASENILRMLMSYKAKLNVVNCFSHTPLSIAVLEKRNLMISILLLRHGARVNKNRPHAMYLFHEAVLNCLKAENIFLLKLLVRHGAFINYVDETGRNALHYAGIAGLPVLIRFLLDAGVKTYVKDKTGRTPHDIAKEHEHREACEILATHERSRAGAAHSLHENR